MDKAVMDLHEIGDIKYSCGVIRGGEYSRKDEGGSGPTSYNDFKTASEKCQKLHNKLKLTHLSRMNKSRVRNNQRNKFIYLWSSAMHQMRVCAVLLLFLGWCEEARAVTEIPGQVVTDLRTLKLAGSPYLVTGDLVIEREGEMRIDPGVELRFLNGVGLTVRGVLVAEGQEGKVIRMTRLSSTDSSAPDFRIPTDIRLVDGPSINEGRLQLLHRDKWRSVCTNSRNWTRNDFEVVCRQLGFRGGKFSTWHARNNDSSQLSYESPSCPPGAQSLTACNWNTKQMGSGVCDYHYDIGILCEPQSIRPLQHWSGIRFDSPQFYFLRKTKVSRSSLRHVEILYAGFNNTGNFTSALEMVGVPPFVNRVTVKWSAFTAINISNSLAAVDIANCLISDNRGYGVYANTSNGMVRLFDSTVLANGADGIKYVFHDIRQPLFSYEAVDFCLHKSQGMSQGYPLIMNAVNEKNDSPNRKSCTQALMAADWTEVLTLHFAYMETSAEFDGGTLEVRDGQFAQSPLLLNFTIRNGTWPQSVSSTGGSLFIKFSPALRAYVSLSLRVTSRRGKAYDLNVTSSHIKENNGRGIAVENMRSLVHVVASYITANKYLAGVHVLGGVGDVNISRTEISNNVGDGVNISYSGGRRNITYCNIMKNSGRGLGLWLNETSAYYPVDQYTVIAYCTFAGGGDLAVQVGNYCRPAVLNITYNTIQDATGVGISIDTCWRRVNAVLKLYVSNNRFLRLGKPALVIYPAVNIDASIIYNRFEGNTKGAMYIANSEKEELETLPANVDINENIFEANTGHYVARIGLSQYSLVQRLRFARNELRKNKVKERYPNLTPRHRASAVVTVSSSNVKIERNLFENPDSRYEIGSHLVNHYAVIDAQLCYFGKFLESDSLKVYNRVFDSKDRYDLATILVTPYLLVPYKDEDRLISSNLSSHLVVDFQPDETPLRLGGTVYGRQELSEGEYTVWRDIYVRSQSELVLNRRTTLKFAPSVGLMVQGKLTVQGEAGDYDQQVLFTLDDIPDGENEPSAVNVRLADGQMSGDVHDGVLQINVQGVWGTVCNYGWNYYSASLACASLSLVANPDDWSLLRSQLQPLSDEASENVLPIIWSSVRCTAHDTDLSTCRVEGVTDFENSCTHSQDVVLRCYRQGWAGLRLGPMADRSDVRGARIERAGVLDWATGAFRPGLQIDLNRHRFQDVSVGRNLDSGVGILMADTYTDVFTRKISSSVFEGNLRHGLVTRTPSLTISQSLVRDNRGNGILYDSSLGHEEQRDLSLWVDKSKTDSVVILTPASNLPGQSRFLKRGEQLFILFDARTPSDDSTTATFKLNTDPDNTFGVQIFTQIHNGTNETVLISSGRDEAMKRTWDLRKNDLDFPLIVGEAEVTIEYERLQRHGHGDAVILVTVVERSTVFPLPGPVPTIRVEGTTIATNKGAGFASVHYSFSVGPIEQRRLRVRNESVEIVRSKFRDNKRAALFVDSPFFNIEDAPVANITYVLNWTTIEGNDGDGVLQTSRDLHGANNIFHWLVAHNQWRANERGGLSLSLPYTTEFNSRMFHTVILFNNSFEENRNFELLVGGHYARLEARRNRFKDNFCYKGLLQVRGTEKEMLMEENIFERNTCEYVAEFNTDSHAEKFGAVPAIFRKNRVQLNRYGTNTSFVGQGATAPTYSPRSYTISLRGIQKVDIINNLFINNSMDYEFLAGIITGSLASSVNVRENWWGTTDPFYIRRRIFDFDDWNSFAVAIFSPFSASPDFFSSVVHEVFNASYVDIENLGGRLYNSTILRRRDRPYIIRSDLTIMPGVTLHIEEGVELQFFPSIGILVLGALRAIGHEALPIRMGPFNKYGYSYSGTSYQRRAINEPSSVRTCVNRKCLLGSDQGFLELYNVTTRQWVPICDPYFTQHNAEVVCKQKGFNPLGAFFIRGIRTEMDPGFVSRVVHWPEPKQCTGLEGKFDECPMRFSGFFRPTYPCAFDDEYVFVYCGRRNLPEGSEYWGGIRFSTPTFEPYISPNYDVPYTVLLENSALGYLDIVGAGILHNEKYPAVTSVSRTPTTFMFVNISQSASHGVSVIAPTESMVIYESRIENNMGVGINVGVLYGESRTSTTSSFEPLSTLYLPYNIFGMVDICSPDKILPVNQRVLVYYKYNHNAADCIKIFSSVGGLRRLGFRLLYLNLLNTTLLSPLPDSLRLFDGDLYGQATPSLIAELTTETDNRRQFIQSVKPSLTVRLHASGGDDLLGFVAEVVTVPTISTNYRDKHHNITKCVMSWNVLGAVHYSNVGEVGPRVAIQNSQFKDNGISLYGNLSTATSAVNLDLQNTVELYVQNNLFNGNQGGLRVVADSETLAASLNAFIANNLLFRNEKWPILELKGRKTSPFQIASVFRNAISQNKAIYNDIILLDSVMSNFSFNFVVNNTGDHITVVTAFDQVSQPNFQVLKYNSWWNNWAIRWDQRATLMLVGSGQIIEENILFNPYNDFEMMIRNISNLSYGNPNHVARIDATNNWWGYNQTWAVSGRIWDGDDEPGLIQVVSRPFYISNATLISGKCPPGWRMIGKTCFIYIGGVMEYPDAELYCESINGSIPYVEKEGIYDLVSFVARQQVNYDLRVSTVWIRTLDTPMRGCSSLRGARDYITPCNSRLPVLCETDPDVYLDPGDWAKYSITYAAIGAVAGLLLIVLIIVLFWLCKSRRRHQEKLDRRNSIRSSIRSASNRSLTGSSTFGSVDITKKKAIVASRPVHLESMIKVNGSIDSIAKSPSRFGSSQFNSSQEDNRSYEVFEAKNNQVEYSDDYDKYLTEAVNRKRTPSSEDFLDETRTTQTPISSVGYGFDNKCYLETHFAAEETPRGSTSSSSLADDPLETKRALERAGGGSGSHSTAPSSSSSHDYYRPRPPRHTLLETEM